MYNASVVTNAVQGEIKICLATFGADQLEQCVEFIRHHVLAHSNGYQVLIGATGVGSHKYKDRLLSYFKNSQYVTLVDAGLVV